MLEMTICPKLLIQIAGPMIKTFSAMDCYSQARFIKPN